MAHERRVERRDFLKGALAGAAALAVGAAATEAGAADARKRRRKGQAGVNIDGQANGAMTVRNEGPVAEDAAPLLPARDAHHTVLHTEILIAGAGTGGCAAALAAAALGRQVILTEETDWLGGQLTTQGVPPDENPWIERFGCTRSYRAYRNGVRDYYRRNFPLTPAAREDVYLNPGGGSVSPLCHDPRVGNAVLHELLDRHLLNGRVRLLLEHKLVAIEHEGDKLRAFTFLDFKSGNVVTIEAQLFIDCTELGDALPLGGVEYVSGFESRSDTGEPHALEGAAQPLNMQAASHCFALDYFPGETHTIDRPRDYDFWRGYRAPFWPGPQLGWTIPHHITHEPRQASVFESQEQGGVSGLFYWRRICARDNFVPGWIDSDITLVNWVHMDYWLGPLCEVGPRELQRHREGARQLSLSFLYWMQTEAPRHDGGTGYPGLRLRPDVFGTADGLAKYPYIREARRIKPQFRILEQHVSEEVRGKQGAEKFADTCGIGWYRIDLHPSTGGNNYIDLGVVPFQIPLGALIPQRVENLLAGGKNIGTTHITNGCYRLHPIEWNIGEAAGTLAAWCVAKGQTPQQVRNDAKRLGEFQQHLARQGVELEWPNPLG